MQIRDIITASIKGTTAMSLFSYVVSFIEEKNFKEPEQLSRMIKQDIPQMDKDKARLAAWVAHYLAGYTFAAVYAEILERADVEPTVLNGVLTGAASGIPAVLIWSALFNLHAEPAHKNAYLRHLIAAHAIFGAFTFAGYAKRRRLA